MPAGPILFLFSAPLADVRFESGVGIQNFLLVVRTAFIKDDVPDHYQELLALSGEAASKRMLTGDVHKPFSHPLPELLLGGPELVVVGAYDPSSLLCSSLGWL